MNKKSIKCNVALPEFFIKYEIENVYKDENKTYALISFFVTDGNEDDKSDSLSYEIEIVSTDKLVDELFCGAEMLFNEYYGYLVRYFDIQEAVEKLAKEIFVKVKGMNNE